MHPVAVTNGRHPYEVAVHASAVACAVALLIVDEVPRSAAETMGPVVRVLWVCLLAAAGVAQLVGAFWRGSVDTALRVELGGVLLLASGTSMYAVALFAVSGIQALASGTFFAGIALGAWWRAAQIIRDIRRLGRAEEGDM